MRAGWFLGWLWANRGGKARETGLSRVCLQQQPVFLEKQLLCWIDAVYAPCDSKENNKQEKRKKKTARTTHARAAVVLLISGKDKQHTRAAHTEAQTSSPHIFAHQSTPVWKPRSWYNLRAWRQPITIWKTLDKLVWFRHVLHASSHATTDQSPTNSYASAPNDKTKSNPSIDYLLLGDSVRRRRFLRRLRARRLLCSLR